MTRYLSRAPRLAAPLLLATWVGCSSATIRHAAFDDGPAPAPTIVRDDAATTAADRRVVALVGDLCGGGTIERTIARRRLAEVGPSALPMLERLAAAAPAESFRRRAIVGAVGAIHRGLDAPTLAGEIRATSGARQRSAIRAAVGLGAPAVPALVDVVEAPGAAHRHEAVIALRRITLLHPMRREADVAHAVRVWRAWYDAAR